MHIRTNDTVEVIRGDERGSRGKVLRIDRSAGRVVVEGVNRVFKHVRRSQRNPQGGRLSKEMSIALSNVLLYCERCGRGRRTAARFADDGAKIRYCKKCGSNLGQISPPKARLAKK
jgi:large subunit ribosomal protein L24